MKSRRNQHESIYDLRDPALQTNIKADLERDLGLEVAEKREDLPNKVLRGNDASGDCVAKGMQLNSLVRLKVLLSKEDVEIGVLLD